MSDPTPSLSETIDAIFAACCLRYGTAYFLARWEGQKMAAIKADWSRVLEGLEKNQRAVRYALDHLPEKPPMAHEFRRIANAMPAGRHPCLTYEVPRNDQAIADAKAKVAALRAQARPAPDGQATARALLERVRQGQRLGQAQREFIRDRLGADALDSALQQGQAAT